MKKIIYFVISFLTVLFMSVCKSDRHKYSTDIKKISIDPNSRQTGRLSLSDIIESVTYIPLETNDNCLVGEITKCIISENYILLYCRTSQHCYLFSKTGRFITQIGKVGQGPGEYTTLSDLLRCDEPNNQVIIRNFTPNRILYYDLNGRFIKSINLEYEGGSMIYHNGFYLLTISNLMGNTPYSYKIFDEDFNIVNQQIKPVQFTMNPPNRMVGGGVAFCGYIYDNQVHVRENMLNDTVYRIDHDLSIVPKYTVNAGKYEITLEIRSNAELFRQEARNRITLSSMFETKDYVLLSYRFSDTYVYGYFRKQEDKILYFSSTSGIPNDYDGGFDFWPKFQNNNQLISHIYAFRFEEHKNNKKLLSPQGKTEDINHFEQMFQKIDSNDNPVIVIAKLK